MRTVQPFSSESLNHFVLFLARSPVSADAWNSPPWPRASAEATLTMLIGVVAHARAGVKVDPGRRAVVGEMDGGEE